MALPSGLPSTHMHSILEPSTLPFYAGPLLGHYALSVPLAVHELALVLISSIENHHAVPVFLIVDEIALVAFLGVLLVIAALAVQLSAHKCALTHERALDSLHTVALRLAPHEFANVLVAVGGILTSLAVRNAVSELAIVGDAVSGYLLGLGRLARGEDSVYVAFVFLDLADLSFENAIVVMALQDSAVLVQNYALVLPRPSVLVTAKSAANLHEAVVAVALWSLHVFHQLQAVRRPSSRKIEGSQLLSLSLFRFSSSNSTLTPSSLTSMVDTINVNSLSRLGASVVTL